MFALDRNHFGMVGAEVDGNVDVMLCGGGNTQPLLILDIALETFFQVWGESSQNVLRPAISHPEIHVV